jgi:hypothetical protein
VQRNGEVWITLRRGSRYRYDPAAPGPFSLREAVDLLRHFETLPLRVTSGTFTSTHPVNPLVPEKERNDPLKWPQHPAFPWYLRTDIHGEVDLVFYAAVDGKQLHVTVGMGSWGHRLREVRYREFDRGNIRRVEKTSAVPVPGACSIVWAGGGSGEYPSDVSLYPHDVDAVLTALEK